MKSVALICMALFISSCSFSQLSKVTVKIHSVEGYGQYEDFARRAAVEFEKVLNSEEFKTEVLSRTYIKTNNLTNQQLYDTILQAHEVQGEGGQDRVVDLRIRTLRLESDEANWKDNCERSTLGIDGKGDGITAICPNKLAGIVARNELDELAGHFAHEYLHIIGFDHYKFLSTQRWREKTFVYKVGNLVSELVAKHMSR